MMRDSFFIIRRRMIRLWAWTKGTSDSDAVTEEDATDGRLGSDDSMGYWRG